MPTKSRSFPKFSLWREPSRLGVWVRLLALRVARVIQKARTLANIGNSSTDNKWTIAE
jgi:hypothetical protein